MPWAWLKSNKDNKRIHFEQEKMSQSPSRLEGGGLVPLVSLNNQSNYLLWWQNNLLKYKAVFILPSPQ